MNPVIQQILQQAEPDLILEELKLRHDRIATISRVWLNEREHFQPLLKAFKHLGADIGLGTNLDLDIRISGDKECFLLCWKLWRSIDIRLSPPEKGSTEIAQHVTYRGLRFWFHFCSTVCKQVQVGTKTIQVPVYETQCGAPLEAPSELPGPEAPKLRADDDIPF